MAIIAIIIIVLFAVYIVWTWNNLYSFNNTNKVINIAIATLILAIITFILFCISKSGIEYPNPSMVPDVRNVLILLFIPINGIILIPHLAKQLSRYKESDIDDDILKKKLLIMVVAFVIIVIIECMYMKNIQVGILKILENMK